MMRQSKHTAWRSTMKKRVSYAFCKTDTTKRIINQVKDVKKKARTVNTSCN